MDRLTLKTSLLCQGIDTRGFGIEKGRKGGAGPAGTCFVVGGMLVNAPITGPYVEESPFELSINNGSFGVSFNGEVFLLEMIDTPRYYSRLASDGTPMKKIALLHGRDCLATTLYQKCMFIERGGGCGFCAIGTTLQRGATILRKTPEQLGEVLAEALKDGINHMTITTGTPNTVDHGAEMLSEAVKHLKGHFDIPIHVQLTPPANKYLDLLYDAGADTIGMHMESFDRSVLKLVCPEKTGFDYKSALEYGVELFGENQVSSFILGGLGEDRSVTERGFEELATLGVIPFLVPFRPLHGARLQDHPPPEPAYMMGLYHRLADVLIKYGVDINKNRAGCVRCGACSAIDIALKTKG